MIVEGGAARGTSGNVGPVTMSGGVGSAGGMSTGGGGGKDGSRRNAERRRRRGQRRGSRCWSGHRPLLDAWRYAHLLRFPSWRWRPLPNSARNLDQYFVGEPLPFFPSADVVLAPT